MSNRYILLFLIFIVVVFSCPEVGGQPFSGENSNVDSSRRLKRAREAFENKAYIKAVEIYQKLNSKGVLPDSDIKNLAQGYLELDNYVKAEEVYASLEEEDLNGEHLFYYAQVLRYNKKYEKADQIMAQYSHQNLSDSRGEQLKNSASLVEELVRNERYIIDEVDFNSAYSDFAPVVQGGILYFTSARGINTIIKRETARERTPYLNVFRVIPGYRSYSEPELFSPVFRSAYHDGPLCFDLNGTELFLTRNESSNGGNENNLKIVHAVRDAAGKWQDPVELPFNDPSFSNGHPFLTQDGKRLWFVSDRPGGFGGTDIYYSDRKGSRWDEPVNAGESINTEGDEMFPFMDKKGYLYFASDGHAGMGGMDIFVARKEKQRYKVKNMGYPLNSSKDDFSIFFLPDQKKGYFASNRSGVDNIYRFETLEPVVFENSESEEESREKVKEKEAFFYGRLVNEKNRDPVSGEIIGILDNQGAYKYESTSDENGIFSVPDSLGGDITFFCAAEHYYPFEEDYNLENPSDTTLLELTPKPFYGVEGVVTGDSGNEPVSRATIFVVSESYDTDTLYTDSDGSFKARLNAYANYNLIFQKSGFFPLRIAYSTMEVDSGQVNLNDLRSLQMKPALSGESIEIQTDTDGEDIRTGDDLKPTLEDILYLLKNNPRARIEIGSHTDSRGNAQDNLEQSQEKAESAADYLVENGVDSSRIAPRGYGENRLKNSCSNGVPCSEEEHKENERTEVTVLN